MKPPLSVSAWPLDGNAWLALTREALDAAKVDTEAIDRWFASAVGRRTLPQIQDACLPVLARHYTVTGGPA